MMVFIRPTERSSIASLAIKMYIVPNAHIWSSIMIRESIRKTWTDTKTNCNSNFWQHHARLQVQIPIICYWPSYAIGQKADIIREKFRAIVEKNSAIDTIVKMCQILSGENMDCDIPPNLIPYYKFAPLTSRDVERSFLTYKSVLSDNRMSFTPKNLEKYLICVCNSKNDL